MVTIELGLQSSNALVKMWDSPGISIHTMQKKEWKIKTYRPIILYSTHDLLFSMLASIQQISMPLING